eukprot:NODE_5734_length_559_cov_16.819444.p1 GENE.NODE_5734_length_559_cov_16.819444~~NODE_5734_length_559_cov_16.819444.p1  ORF type:complete len:134 (-),score=31.47 NODE_5734_length_559_cov_16.819444:108-509(-)
MGMVLPHEFLENLIGLRYNTTFTRRGTILKEFRIEESELYSLVEKLGSMLFILERKANPDAKLRVQIFSYNENDQTMFAVYMEPWHGEEAFAAAQAEAARKKAEEDEAAEAALPPLHPPPMPPFNWDRWRRRR